MAGATLNAAVLSTFVVAGQVLQSARYPCGCQHFLLVVQSHIVASYHLDAADTGVF